MSIICINEHFENENSNATIQNRGFLYADGLFETMIHNGKEILYFQDHMMRLKKGLDFFRFETPPFFSQKIKKLITLTLQKNNLKNGGRVKLIVWRNNGGLYTPTQNSFSFIIRCSEENVSKLELKKLGVYKTPLLPHSKLGNFKTLNSLYYVHAGQIKTEMRMDDLILLNTSEEICECTSSNIFWRKKDEYFTPHLNTGCIDGIMRKQFLSELTKKGKKVNEGNFKLTDLSGADEFFLTNVTGIRTTTKLIE